MASEARDAAGYDLPRLRDLVEHGDGVSRALALDLIDTLARLEAERDAFLVRAAVARYGLREITRILQELGLDDIGEEDGS